VQDVNDTNIWYGGAGYGPICTTNSGTNWQYIVNGIAEVDTFKIGFHPTDSNRIYIPCGDLGLAIVTDGGLSGNTLTMAHLFFPNDIVQYSHRALACFTNGCNRVIFPGGCLNTQARIYANTNDTNWYYPPCVGLPTNVNGAEIVDAIDSLDNPDDFLVVCGGTSGVNLGGIYRTTNAGASFTQCNWYPSPSQNLGTSAYWFVFLDRDATNVNVRYLFADAQYPSIPPATNSGGGFFVSTNRGVTWTQTTGATGGVIPNNWSDWGGYLDGSRSRHQRACLGGASAVCNFVLSQRAGVQRQRWRHFWRGSGVDQRGLRGCAERKRRRIWPDGGRHLE
jgi:hypothetical protein